MKTRIFILLCFVNSYFSIAQNDSEKIDYLERKADYFLKNKDSLKFYADKILKQSKIEKSKKAEGLAYKYFAKVAFMERDYVASDKFAKKAISVFNKLENKLNKTSPPRGDDLRLGGVRSSGMHVVQLTTMYT